MVEKAAGMEPHKGSQLRKAKGTSLKLYEEAWVNTCHKVALDSYRRPICFVVPPQLLAATLVYTSELYVLRLALFKASNHTCV